MDTEPRPLTERDWLIIAIAAIGFAFDIYELLMLPLVAPPALVDMGIPRGTPAHAVWMGRLFWYPAIAGGLFGLLGGYLTDALGRRRVLTWSIMLYAGSAAAAAFATTPESFLVLRCATFVGVCVEFVAAVAWLAELFPEPRRREAILGATQAFSSLGGLMVTGAYFACVRNAESFPAIYGAHAAWRYTLLTGLLPALPLLIVRPFLPESPIWEQRKAAGTLRRPSFGELFAPELARTTVLATILVAVTYGMAYGALQQLPRIVPGLPQVKDLPEKQRQEIVSTVQLHQETGGMVGRVLLGLFAMAAVSRRTLYRMFVIPGLFIVPWVFIKYGFTDLEMLKVGVFVSAIFIVGQMSFWGNYLPLVFPLHLRGTGEGFAANVGGRMLGTSAGWISATLAPTGFAGGLAGTAGVVALGCFVIALAGSFLLPEPGRELRTD